MRTPEIDRGGQSYLDQEIQGILGAWNAARTRAEQSRTAAPQAQKEPQRDQLADVSLACRGVRNTVSAYAHCGLFVHDGANVRSQFSLGGHQTEFSTSPDTNRDDLAAFRGGEHNYRIQPPQHLSQEQFDTCITSQAQNYRAHTYRLFEGPNSNSAAAYPIITCGGRLPNVNQGWVGGAPALDYWLRNSLVP